MSEHILPDYTAKYGAIWNKLTSLDLTGFVVKKQGTGNPEYLSWGDAWGLVMKNYPASSFRFHRSDKRYDGDEVFEALNGSAEVRCTVCIDGVTREMWLPVMDHKFKAIVDPDARDVSDAKMRCLVKCLALFGLGHSLYAKAKEDVPDDSRSSGGGEGAQRRGRARSEGRDAGGVSRPSNDPRDAR